jgi:hypothetical protein
VPPPLPPLNFTLPVQLAEDPAVPAVTPEAFVPKSAAKTIEAVLSESVVFAAPPPAGIETVSVSFGRKFVNVVSFA